MEEIPALGKKGDRGAGEKAAIALALELDADYLVIDDRAVRREAAKRGLSTLWTLQVLDEAADRGWVRNLPAVLERLEHETPFYIGEVARGAIEAMKQRDRERKEAKPHGTGPPSSQGDWAPEPLD
jgi:predicted nucleic acid-binding protein